MKKYLLMMSMVLGLYSFTKAQQKGPSPSEMLSKNIDTLNKRLKLNPTQKSIIYNYLLDLSREQVDLSKKQAAGTFGEDDVSRFYKIQNQTTKNIRNVLKEDQQVEYDKYLEEQLRGGNKKKKKGKKNKDEEEEVVTGISGLKLPAGTPPANQ